MKFNLQTSLFALAFAVGVSSGFAAPTVRSLGGATAVSGTTAQNTNVASNANVVASNAASTSLRAGSLRTGGYVSGPTVKTSVSNVASSGGASGASGAGIVAGTTPGGRGASTPRLSTGRYIGAPGKSVSTDGADIDLSGKVDKDQGISNAGLGLIVDNSGFVTTGEIVTPERLETDLSGKVDKDQGVYYAGKALIVNEQGLVEPAGEFLTTGDIDMSGKVDKDQGLDAAGNVLSVDARGYVTSDKQVYFKPEADELLNKKLDNNMNPELYEGRALIVTETGDIKPVGDFVDADQGVENAKRVLTVGADGGVVPGKIVYSVDETDNLLRGKLDNTADPGQYAGKALVVGDDGVIEPTGDLLTPADISGKVDKYQGTDFAGRALIVNDEGYVTTGRVNTSSLGLKQLAYEDTVRNELVDDNTLERAKMAASITDTLEWIDTWRDKEPTADGETRYVMAFDEYGQAAWFRVATE